MRKKKTMRCYFYSSRDCERLAKEGRSGRRRDDDYGRNSRRHSRYGWLLILNDSIHICKNWS
jgi:hypothetical protein